MRKHPRVLFIVPPVRLHNEDLEYLVHLPRHAVVLAAELQPEYDVAILDVSAEFHQHLSQRDQVHGSELNREEQDLNLAELMRDLINTRIKKFEPDILVVHAHAAPHLPIVKLAFDAVIEVQPSFPAMKIAIGGMVATHLAQEVADWAPDSSWIFRGEGTGRIIDLFSLIRGQRKPNLSTEIVSKMKGQRRPVRQTRECNGSPVDFFEHPAPTEVTVVDISRNPPIMDYPLPRFDLLPMDTYVRLFKEGRFVPHLEMSSGCTFACKFCGVHYLGAEGRFRRRPTKNVIEEMKHLRNQFGLDEFYFCDETFTLDRKHARELCEQMAQELPGIRWRCVTRVDKVDEEMGRLMSASGCFEIGFGVEVGNNEVLQENTKEATVDLNIETISLVQSMGIDANALTIIGMPQEDHSDIRRTFEFLARDAKPNRCQIFVFHPVPGTEYFKIPEAYGLRFDTRDIDEWYKWDHIGEPVCDTTLLSKEDIARYFILFNKAFSTMMWPERDEGLIKHVLENRFPIRRKGITWHFDGSSLRIYKNADSSMNILNNVQELVFTGSDDNSDNLRQLQVLEFMLSRSCGQLTDDEISSEVSKIFDLSGRTLTDYVEKALHVLGKLEVITQF